MGKRRRKAGPGRPRKSGKRTESGRLSRAKGMFPERGANGPTDRRQDRFRHFLGSGSIGHEMTCIGRLMLVGAFDGIEIQPDAALNALRDYSDGYWRNYHEAGPVESDYIKEVRSRQGLAKGEIPDDPTGKWFDAVDAVLRDCGHQTRMAVHSVTVDLHWFPDDDAPWAGRIINSRVLQKREQLLAERKPVEGLTVSGELACDSDWAMLRLLCDGAIALARGEPLASPIRSAA